MKDVVSRQYQYGCREAVWWNLTQCMQALVYLPGTESMSLPRDAVRGDILITFHEDNEIVPSIVKPFPLAVSRIFPGTQGNV